MNKLIHSSFLLLLSSLVFLSCDNNLSTNSVGNHPPEEPQNLSPPDGAVNIPLTNVTLTWQGSDPDYNYIYGYVSYTINDINHFIHAYPVDWRYPRCTLKRLFPGARYRWHVTIRDEHNYYTSGPYWEFYTIDTTVTFADRVLELLVREEIGKASGDLYASELNEISYLWLTGLRLSNLSGMEYLIGLESLYLGGNDISDITPIGSLVGLEVFAAEFNDISDLTPLADLVSLDELWLPVNDISDVSPLSEITFLESINLGGNHIEDITPLSELCCLGELDLDGNPITDINALAEMEFLEDLYLHGCQITDVSPLSHLTQLKHLDLGGNQFNDISSLSTLNLLENLNLNRTQITDITPLAGMIFLVSLSLADNQISNISVMQEMVFLENLYLRDNQIINIEPLVNNSGIGYGDHVNLHNNPLDSVSINVYIPELEARGVYVSY